MKYILMMHGNKDVSDEYAMSAAPGPGGGPGNMPVEVRQVLGTHSDLGF